MASERRHDCRPAVRRSASNIAGIASSTADRGCTRAASHGDRHRKRRRQQSLAVKGRISVHSNPMDQLHQLRRGSERKCAGSASARKSAESAAVSLISVDRLSVSVSCSSGPVVVWCR